MLSGDRAVVRWALCDLRRSGSQQFSVGKDPAGPQWLCHKKGGMDCADLITQQHEALFPLLATV